MLIDHRPPAVTTTAGFLFIGDPHVSSRRIGRRKDDYLTSVLTKLSACADLCRERNLTPVILGDLFHRNGDNSLNMLNRLTAVLNRFPSRPLVLEGNHDKAQTQLSEDDALMLLHQTGVVTAVMTGGLWASYDIDGDRVHLMMQPYGTSIPDEVQVKQHFGDGTVIMVTHHDLAFGGAYPNALPLKPIVGVDMAVNGHMHDTKPAVQCEQTWWHCPGNIEPLSVDLIDHKPCAWEWSPMMGTSTLLPHDLPHGTDLFDLTGIQVEAADAEVSVAQVLETSHFAQLLGAESAMGAQKTDDASVLREDLEMVFGASNASPASMALMRALAQSLTETTTANA